MATTSAISSSSIDVQGLVSQLMTVEKQPLTKLQSQEASVNSRISALGNIQSKLSAIQTAATALGSVTTFNATKATVTGTGVTAAVGGYPATGTYKVSVTSLATAQSTASTAQDAAATLGTGKLTLTQGTNTIDIDVGGADQPTTLAGVRDAINAQTKVGVSATLVGSGTNTRLVVNARTTGAANAFTLGGTGSMGGLGFANSQTAADASYSVNGLALTSPTNSVSDAISGVTLVLAQQPAAGSPVGTTVDSQVTIANDNDAVKTKVTDFITAFNAANTLIRSQTSFDAATKVAGPLNGEAVLRNGQAALSAVLRGVMTPAQAGDYTRLGDVGVSVQKDGSLSLDSAKFDAAIAADAGKVKRLFVGTAGATGDAKAFGPRLRDTLDTLAGSSGTLQSREDGLRSQVKRMDKQIADWQSRLTVIQSRLTKQYSTLDTLLSTRQSQSDALANALAKL